MFPAICLQSPSIQRKLFGESLETFTNYSPFRKILSRTSLSTANFIPPFLALRKCWHEIQTYKNRSFARDAVLEELHFYDLKHNLVGIVVAQQKIS